MKNSQMKKITKGIFTIFPGMSLASYHQKTRKRETKKKERDVR